MPSSVCLFVEYETLLDTLSRKEDKNKLKMNREKFKIVINEIDREVLYTNNNNNNNKLFPLSLPLSSLSLPPSLPSLSLSPFSLPPLSVSPLSLPLSLLFSFFQLSQLFSHKTSLKFRLDQLSSIDPTHPHKAIITPDHPYCPLVTQEQLLNKYAAMVITLTIHM